MIVIYHTKDVYRMDPDISEAHVALFALRTSTQC